MLIIIMIYSNTNGVPMVKIMIIIFFYSQAAPHSEPPDSVGAGVTQEEDDGQLPKCCRGCQSKHRCA